MSSRTLTSTTTILHYCTTPPSPSCSTDKFQSVTSRVAVVHHACGSTASVVLQSEQCGRWRGSFVAPSHTRPPIRRLSQRGAPSGVSTLSSYAGSALLSGRLESTPNSHNHVACKERSMSCLVEARRLRRSTLSRQHCTNSLTRRLPASVLQPPVQIHQHSRLHLSAAYCGCLRQPRQKT